MANKNIKGWDSLHPKQQQLYELLLKNSEGLTLESMREDLDVSAINTVVYHLKQLEKKGYIRRQGTNGRIEVLSAPVQDIVYLNLYGMVGCGPDGFFNGDNVVDRIPFPAKRMRVNAGSFLVEARGNSMEPMIHDKDLVLVDESPVNSGDVAVVVYGNGAVLKKIYKEKNNIILQSLNPKVEPFVVNSGEITTVGIVRGVVHNFSERNLKVKKSR